MGSNEEGHERAHEGGAECANDGTEDMSGILNSDGKEMSREEMIVKLETWELVIAKYYEYWIAERYDYQHHLIEIDDTDRFI